MSKYSTLLFPVEDYHHIGPFRFPIHKDLAPGELQQFTAINKAQAKNSFESMRLAKKIAQDKKITNKEALDLLSNIGAPENQDMIYEYLEEIEAVTEKQLDDTAQLVAYATAMLQMRGEVRFPNETEYKPCPDWTAEDTKKVPRKMLQEIFDFVLYERDGWPEPQTEGKPQAELPPEPAAEAQAPRPLKPTED